MIEENFTLAKQYFQKGDIEKAENFLLELFRENKKNLEVPEYKELGEKILLAKQEIKHQKIQKKRKIPKKGIVTTQKFLCPNCKSNIEIFSPESETITCKKCRAIIDLESDSIAFTLNSYYKNKPPYLSFLRLGYILNFKNSKYQIIGRSKKYIMGDEWDSEDNRYTSYSWRYDEWILLGEKKEILYLSEDEDGYKISQSFVPKNPIIPTNQDFMNLSGRNFSSRIIERGTIKTLYVEGEFPWRLQVGDISHFAESKTSNWFGKETRESVEWKTEKKPKEKTKKITEVEFFKTEKIGIETLIKALDEKSDPKGKLSQIKKEILINIKKAKQNRIWGKLFVTTSIILFLFSFSKWGDGKLIFSDNLTISPYQSEKILGPIPLEKKDTVYTIKLESNVHGSNNWNASTITLLNANKLPINRLEGEFWSESGSDSDGSWSESYSHAELVFYIENPSKYFIAFAGEAGNVTGSIFTVKIYENTPLARYYLLFAILSGIIGILLLYFNKKSGIYEKVIKTSHKTNFSSFSIKVIIFFIYIFFYILSVFLDF